MNEQETYIVSFPVTLAPRILAGGLVTVEEELARRVAGVVQQEIYRNQAQDLIHFHRLDVTVTKAPSTNGAVPANGHIIQPLFREPAPGNGNGTTGQAPLTVSTSRKGGRLLKLFSRKS